jgi:hypothetical protein
MKVISLVVLLCWGMATAQISQISDLELMVAMPSSMLSQPPVQKELHLDKGQKSHIQEVIQSAAKNVQSMPDFSKIDVELLAILNEQQAARFHEIRLQVLGMRSLEEKDVADGLALTEEQKSSVVDYAKAERQGFMDAARKGATALSSFQKGRSKREEELAKILTPEQSAKLASLFGKPFKDVKRIRGAG